MSGGGAELARAAERLLGTGFRLHGRDPAIGLDCVGLVAASLGELGRDVDAPAGYRLRRTGVGDLLPFAEAAGLRACAAPLAAGDVVLVRPGPVQFHLVIAVAAGGFVHAHAGLGRVVLTPGPLPWAIERRWRLQDKG